MQSKAHGVIDQQHIDRKADYLFRISLKCLIRNGSGEVLVVKESGRGYWDLPGGGMDHEEGIKLAIARELHEEVSLTGDFTYNIIAAEEPKFLPGPKVWQMRLVFNVHPHNMTFEAGEDGDEVAFMNPALLKDSENAAERRVYQYATLMTEKTPHV